MIEIKPAVLVLADGSIYRGWSCSELGTVIGEVVFNTGMTGYQEILTDPSYCGQIVTFTYPELGNTGINFTDRESVRPFVRGIVVKNLCKLPSSWRSRESLEEYLQLHGIMCIYGIDTRSLTKHIRKSGSMNAIISNEVTDIKVLLQKIKTALPMQGADLVTQVTTQSVYSAHQKLGNEWYFQPSINGKLGEALRVVVVDFGIKINILRRLQNLGCEAVVVPANTSAEMILSYGPDGVLLSNGPGDPSAVIYGVQTIKSLFQYSIPIFGICMGHQLLSIALGYDTYKLKFGHHGLNHPTGWSDRVQITSQNHGFAVNSKSLNNNGTCMKHVNFNDNTIAGISHNVFPIFSVQYHPEASPGPHDSDYLFAYFVSVMCHLRKGRNTVQKDSIIS